jgi:hypothetical protein
MQMLDKSLMQWEGETIRAIERASADSEIDLSDLVELGALAIKPLAQELRVLLLQQAEKYVDEAAQKIGFQLHKEMAIARKKVSGTEDEIEALIPADSAETAASSIRLLQDELAALLEKVRNNLQSKLDSKIAGRVLHLGSKLFNQVTKGEHTLNQLQTKADSFEKGLRQKMKNGGSDIIPVTTVEDFTENYIEIRENVVLSRVELVIKDTKSKYLPADKLGEMVKSDRVQGILGRDTSYSNGKGGRCSQLCTMVGRTIGRSRATLTEHENELGE